MRLKKNQIVFTHIFTHRSTNCGRVLLQFFDEECKNSSSSAVFSLQREQRTKPEARFFWVLCAEYIYLLGIIDFDFRLLWKQQTTGRSKISSTRSPSRTFSGILLLLLLLLLLLPLRRRRRNQRRSTIFFSDAFSSCRDVEWTSPFAKKNAPMMMHR